jgi:hypothetical protein
LQSSLAASDQRLQGIGKRDVNVRQCDMATTRVIRIINDQPRIVPVRLDLHRCVECTSDRGEIGVVDRTNISPVSARNRRQENGARRKRAEVNRAGDCRSRLRL